MFKSESNQRKFLSNQTLKKFTSKKRERESSLEKEREKVRD